MDLKALGRRIRSLRLDRGLTQEQLGELAGVNYKYIGEIERADKTASIETLAKIAAGLDIPLTELLRFEHEAGTGKDVAREIRKLLNDMDEDQLRLTLKLLRAIRY